jgi:benzoyl-CoA-dihydrodiol lyase
MGKTIDFQTEPARYQHWRVQYEGNIATVLMDVNEGGGLFEGYELKLNSYDLGVDIELADIVQRMRFEHPEVKTVILRSGKENVFCSGANIRMLAGAEHAHKVNFCKFTNETRNTFEAAAEDSGQNYICAIKGACAGGGYELALACNYIMLADDRASNVALPEVPLLAVLPGTGGLTRVTDKRKVRRDLADVFCTVEEGVKGKRALDWRLVDEIIPNAQFEETVALRAQELAEQNPKPEGQSGIRLEPLQRTMAEDGSLAYSTVQVQIDREKGLATLLILGPEEGAPESAEALRAQGASSWMLRCARELDDAILHLRFNELSLGTWLFKTQGDAQKVIAHEQRLLDQQDSWLAREILLYWKRILKRVDVTSRSLVTLIEPGSCFAGTLAELAFAADRSYMAEGMFEDDDRPIATLSLTEANFGRYPMSNGITRLETRFWGTPEALESLRTRTGTPLEAGEAHELGLVTFALDDIDWEDEIRVFLEERTSFSPDSMTGMEANLRFAGPETMETRIFARLTAWQNWIFQRPNAVGEKGALRRYGSGYRGEYDMRRV